jgi:hypothetical protein
MVGRKLLTVVLYEFFICMRLARKFSRAAFHVNCLFLISFNHLNPRGKRHMYYRLAKKKLVHGVALDTSKKFWKYL